MTNRATSLFNRTHLSEVLALRRTQAEQALLAIDEDVLLATPIAEIAADLREKYGFAHPVLDRSSTVSIRAEKQSVNLGPGYGMLDIRRTVVVRAFDTPFSGDASLFAARPSQHSLHLPAGLVDSRSGLLRVFVEDSPGNTPDSIAIKAQVEQRLDHVEQWLDWGRPATEEHNRAIFDPGPIERRREEILAERAIEIAIGYPLKPQDHASASVPLIRRHVETSLTRKGAAPYKPEPSLSDSDYEAILRILADVRLSLERTPSVAAALDEEGIRDLLLVALNGNLQGSASGETFNMSGKTDILVRVDGQNVFIGECKIWKGQKGISVALDQLTGYLSWRDVKAALLVFLRSGDVTAVGAKCVAAIESHPLWKRTTSIGAAGERSDFVLRARDDHQREIRLALLPFVLPN